MVCIRIQQITATGQPVGVAFIPSNSGDTGLRNAGAQYIDNWSTKGLLPGLYDIIVTLDDGTVQTIQIPLR